MFLLETNYTKLNIKIRERKIPIPAYDSAIKPRERESLVQYTEKKARSTKTSEEDLTTTYD